MKFVLPILSLQLSSQYPRFLCQPPICSPESSSTKVEHQAGDCKHLCSKVPLYLNGKMHCVFGLLTPGMFLAVHPILTSPKENNINISVLKFVAQCGNIGFRVY